MDNAETDNDEINIGGLTKISNAELIEAQQALFPIENKPYRPKSKYLILEYARKKYLKKYSIKYGKKFLRGESNSLKLITPVALPINKISSWLLDQAVGAYEVTEYYRGAAKSKFLILDEARKKYSKEDLIKYGNEFFRRGSKAVKLIAPEIFPNDEINSWWLDRAARAYEAADFEQGIFEIIDVYIRKAKQKPELEPYFSDVLPLSKLVKTKEKLLAYAYDLLEHEHSKKRFDSEESMIPYALYAYGRNMQFKERRIASAEAGLELASYDKRRIGGRVISDILSVLLNYRFENICDSDECMGMCYIHNVCPNDKNLFEPKNILECDLDQSSELVDKMFEFSMRLKEATAGSYLLSGLLNYDFENFCDVCSARPCYSDRGCPKDEKLFGQKIQVNNNPIFLEALI